AEVAGGEVEAAVEELIEADLLMREGQSILSLPIGSKPRTTEELYALVFHRRGVEPLPPNRTGGFVASGSPASGLRHRVGSL
ncbi:MAG: hypothetical protein ACLQU3_14090, partial [Limisphaerales bacterium]